MKRKLMAYLLVIITLTCVMTIFFIGNYSTSASRQILDYTKNDMINQVQHHFELFDNFIFIIETQIKKRSEESIKLILQAIPDYETSKKVRPEELKALAARAGINEIYFINRTGVVYNTSFPPDMSLDLYKASSSLTEYISQLFGKGEFQTQHLGVSMNTGTINNYSYFSPKGSDYLIETSIDVIKYIDDNYEKGFYNRLRLLFFARPSENTYLKSFDLYTLTNISSWSLINEKKKFRHDRAMIDRILANKEMAIANGNTITIYKKIESDARKTKWSGEHTVLEMTFDFNPIAEFENKMIYCTAAGCLVIIILTFLFSGPILNNCIIRRILNISDGLKAIETGNYEIRLTDDGHDELTNICNNVNIMAKTISNHIKSLEELIPICASCKKVRDDRGYWNQVEHYLLSRTGIKFTHGICPECTRRLYPELNDCKSGDTEDKS